MPENGPYVYPLNERSTGGEVLARYVELALGTFPTAKPTAEDHAALADHLGFQAAVWINRRYGMGLPNGAR